MPKVSVIIPSYNHERFVRECIQSVLDQTFQDFEIVITDDGSRDHTVDVIRSFKDSRIRLFVHPENRGACIAANNCIERSRGQYIAMLSSDDVWLPEKLERQVGYLDAHPEIGAVFGKAQWIDAESRPIDDKGFPYLHVFDVENRSRWEWLHHFFYVGNSLCHPCSLVRRECYDTVGLLDPSFANLPDFDLWVRLCLKYEIHVLDERLIRFRRTNEASHASGDTMRSKRRNRFEYKQILNHYLELKSPRELLAVFPDAEKYGTVRRDTIPYFVARAALDRRQDFTVLWGLDVLYNLLKDEKTARLLEKQYGFTHRLFIQLTGEGVAFIDLAAYEAEARGAYRFGLRVQSVRMFLLPSGSRREWIARAVYHAIRGGLRGIGLGGNRRGEKAPLT